MSEPNPLTIKTMYGSGAQSEPVKEVAPKAEEPYQFRETPYPPGVEISPRTGKPKKKPRGKPFGEGKDGRRRGNRAQRRREQGQKAGKPSADEFLPKVLQGAEKEKLAALETLLKGGMDPDEVRKLIQEEIAKLDTGYKPVEIKIPEMPPVKLEGLTHSIVPKILQRIHTLKASGRPQNVAMWGEAGTGKTTIAKSIGTALGFTKEQVHAISINDEMSISEVKGRTLVNLSTGKEVYIPAKFVELYEHGGVSLWDEADNMNGSWGVACNAAIENGHFALPDGRVVSRHENFVFLLGMNTPGTGGNRMYQRRRLDAAFMDRFRGAIFHVDYCPDIEKVLCPDENLRKMVLALRADVRKRNMERVVSTRLMVACHALVKCEKYTPKAAIAECISDWSEADRKVVGYP